MSWWRSTKLSYRKKWWRVSDSNGVTSLWGWYGSTPLHPHGGIAYSREESNLQHAGSEPTASTFGLREHELHPLRANGRDRTDCLRRTKAAHYPQCLAGMEPTVGLEPTTSGVQARCAYPRRLTGMVSLAEPPEGFEPSASSVPRTRSTW